MLPNIPFKIFTLTCLLIVISSLQLANASNIGKPVIAMSEISCNGYYLLEIYENGEFEFRSTGRKKLGGYKSQINRKKLDALINRFVEADFIAADNRHPGLALSNSAIRFRHGDQVATVFFQLHYARPKIINELADNLIQTTGVKQWLPNSKAPKIIDKTKKETACMNSDLAVVFEFLKFK